MTSRISKLVLAAVLAGSLPAAAAARDCDRHAPAVVAPAPWQPAHLPPRDGWRDHRRAGWRERELASLRAELHALDVARADFHARYAGRPGKLRRYDRGYLERRAALERRWHELTMVAWR